VMWKPRLMKKRGLASRSPIHSYFPSPPRQARSREAEGECAESHRPAPRTRAETAPPPPPPRRQNADAQHALPSPPWSDGGAGQPTETAPKRREAGHRLLGRIAGEFGFRSGRISLGHSQLL
jgi:hypothetical protein